MSNVYYPVDNNTIATNTSFVAVNGFTQVVVHFPLTVTDTSTVQIGFHILAAGLHFALTIVDISVVYLNFYIVQLFLRFPLVVASNSTIWMGYSISSYITPQGLPFLIVSPFPKHVFKCGY